MLPTAWYDGNPAAYRHWVVGEPDDHDRCVVYTANGFDDKECNEQHYYTCKKGAGSLSDSVMHSLALAVHVRICFTFIFRRMGYKEIEPGKRANLFQFYLFLSYILFLFAFLLHKSRL